MMNKNINMMIMINNSINYSINNNISKIIIKSNRKMIIVRLYENNDK